ncbi:MAG TPA: lipocalin/fatty-acid binding family protein [Ignavibacteriales bacterium]|nr:lipocalin/fatty-acid binding family protein [Ignavibacteriales bacterium]
MSESQITTDHNFIRKWVEERGGKPTTVKGTVHKGEQAGLLRIDFPGYSGEGSLEEISWDEFFRQFEESKLAFLYQDKSHDGKQSRFNKFVSREGEEVRRAGKH